MVDLSKLSHAELEELKAAVANSPIMQRRLALAARLADWQTTRMAPDVDEVILAWLASHSASKDARKRAYARPVGRAVQQ